MHRLDTRGFLALDGMSQEAALGAMRDYAEEFFGVKLNDALLGDVGATLMVTKAAEYGCPFADAKLHDTYPTVANGVRKLAGAGAYVITVHASGGIEMMRAARDAYHEAKPSAGIGGGILGVTVLTSLDEEECQRSYGSTRIDAVLRFADMAAEAGVFGIICSAGDAAEVTKRFPTLKKFVPGTRLADGEARGQKQIASPLAAFENGADFIVVGSDVLKSADPKARVAAYNRHLAGARG